MSSMGSVLETEAEAMRWAIQTISRFGNSQVVFETDSITLKRLIKGKEPMWPRMKPLTLDARDLCFDGRKLRL